MGFNFLENEKQNKLVKLTENEDIKISIEKIIMITGSKGGGGKSPCAISVAMALHELNVPILACDFNFNNHDMLTVFLGTNIEERRDNNWLEEHVIGVDPFWRISNNFWITRWNSIMNLGLPSTTELWDRILQLAQTKFPDNQPKVMVFDTNLTLPLICPPVMKVQDYGELPEIEVWHLWSPSIALQIDEQDRFVKAINLLNKFNPGFEKRMTHIFTPRHFTTTNVFGTFSSLIKGEFNITKKAKFKQSNPKPILFSELKDALFANFISTILNYNPNSDTKIDEILSMWLKRVIEVLEHREYLTDNVIIVPTIVHKIALLVEELTLKPRRTLDTIKKDLGTLYEIMIKHISENRSEMIQSYSKNRNVN